jgi:mycothiol synthase
VIQPLPAGVRARPVTAEDLDAVVSLFETYDREVVGDVEPRREFLSWIWGRPYIDLARDTTLVTGADGPIGYAQAVHDPAGGGPVFGVGVVHPDHRGRGLGTWLLGWIEDVRGRVAPSELVRIAVPAADAGAASLLASRGCRQVRTSWDLTRGLDTDLPTFDPPAGVSFRTFVTGQDERVFYEVANTAFVDHWDHRDQPYETYAADMYEADDWDPSLAIIAEADGEPVGELVALEFAAMGYIASVGVLGSHRGRGIARALLSRAFSDLASRGHRVVELTVDAQNPTGAVRLYEGMGMTVRRETHIYDDDKG